MERNTEKEIGTERYSGREIKKGRRKQKKERKKDERRKKERQNCRQKGTGTKKVLETKQVRKSGKVSKQAFQIILKFLVKTLFFSISPKCQALATDLPTEGPTDGLYLRNYGNSFAVKKEVSKESEAIKKNSVKLRGKRLIKIEYSYHAFQYKNRTFLQKI